MGRTLERNFTATQRGRVCVAPVAASLRGAGRRQAAPGDACPNSLNPGVRAAPPRRQAERGSRMWYCGTNDLLVWAVALPTPSGPGLANAKVPERSAGSACR